MVAPFTYAANPARVVFGPGRLAELGAELDRLAIRRAFVLSTPEQAGMAEAVSQQLGAKASGIYTRAAMHTPTDVTADALAKLQATGCDGLVALGGGSTIGLGKALALCQRRDGFPQKRRVKFPHFDSTSVRSCRVGATVLGPVKGRAPGRAPQAVSSLDRSCAPRLGGGVGTRASRQSTAPPAGRTRAGRSATGWIWAVDPGGEGGQRRDCSHR